MDKFVFAIGIMFFSAAGSAALAQTSPMCGRYPAGAPSLTCTCAPGTLGSSVWGVGPYTGDSDLCAAARHSGVIGAEGGEIVAEAVEGLARYDGSEQNGVTTRSWGSYPFSVQFVVPAMDVAECRGFSAKESPLTCACPANPARSGSVWGSSPFTGDSDICTAAQFEGVLGTGAGVVRVLATAGLEAYAENSRNGISTRSWGKYGESFVFDWNLK